MIHGLPNLRRHRAPLSLLLALILFAPAGASGAAPNGVPEALWQTPASGAIAAQSSGTRQPWVDLDAPYDSARAADSDWFQIKKETLANWNLTQDSPDGTRLVLTPKEKTNLTGPEKNVLVLYYKPSSAYETGISKLLDVFHSKHARVSFTVIFFAAKAELGLAALEYAREKKFDLIMPMGSEATDFVHKNFRGGPIPVVTLLNKDPVLLGQVEDYTRGSGTNIAYTSVNMPIDVQMAYLKQLKKEIKNIAIVYAKSSTSAIEAQVNPLKKVADTYGFSTLDIAIQDDKRAREEFAEKVPAAVAEMRRTDPALQRSIFWITAATPVIEAIDTLLENADKVPVISAFPDIVKEGPNSAVFSLGISFESATYLAAVYADDILAARVRPGDLKVGVVTPPDIAINFSPARRIGLKIPFSFFESAGYVYNYQGKLVRKDGQPVNAQ